MSLKAALAVLVTFTGSLSAFSAKAEETVGDWVPLTESTEYEWQGKKGSGYVGSLDGVKNASYAYVYQAKNKARNTFEYGKIVVKLDACKQGYGYVYYNDMDGKYVNKIPFVRFGGTVADGLGTAGCSTWDSETKKVSRSDGGDNWELVATSKQSGDKFALKTDTARKRNYKGSPSLTALFSYRDVKASTTNYSEYVIAASDCKRGYGTIHELDLNGDVVGKNDVVLGGQSVIAAVAKNLCDRL